MTQTKAEAPRRMNAGFTMVELLVATTLGLVILVAVTNIFVGSRQSYRTQEGLTQVQETGRLLNYLVYPYIRLAGYLPTPIKQTDPSAVFTSALRALGGTNNDADATNDILAGTDTITIRYLGQGVGSTADGAIGTCLSATGVPPDTMVRSRFYVTVPDTGSNPAEPISNLRCEVSLNESATVSVQPILQGVTDLQVLYGVGVMDGSTLDRVTQRYYTADAVPDWTAVTSVRLTITADSLENNVSTAPGTSQGRLRRTFTSTLQIRNRLN